ncbi:hypothetical protein [Priestia aryabhattai]
MLKRAKKNKNKKKEGFLRELWDEIVDTIIFEIVWGAISTIFRFAIRSIKHIF